jgi:hypothetical protein
MVAMLVSPLWQLRPLAFTIQTSKDSRASCGALREHRIEHAGGAAKRLSTAIALFSVGARLAGEPTPRIESVVVSQGRPDLSFVTLAIAIGRSSSASSPHAARRCALFWTADCVSPATLQTVSLCRQCMIRTGHVLLP